MTRKKSSRRRKRTAVRRKFTMDDDVNDDVFEPSSNASRVSSSTNDPLTLDQCIKQIMSQKRAEYQDKRQTAYRSARRVAERLLQCTYAIHPLYQKYVRLHKSGRVEILNFRALDTNVFLCIVPLKRPIRPCTFAFHHKRPQEYPTHRMFLSLNEDLPREEKIPLKQEWGHCVDKTGVVRPDFVLKWFNKGLRNMCDVFQQAERQKKMDPRRRGEKEHFDMFLEKSKDGTLWTYITMGEDEEKLKTFKINFVPSIPLQEVPKQLRMSAPIPNRRPYLKDRTDFVQSVTRDIEQGLELFYLEARLFDWNLATGYHQSIAVSWGVGSASLEDRTYKEICKVTNASFLDNIILLMGQIKSEHKVGLPPISNRVILNAIFHVHRKNLCIFKAGEEWFLAALELLLAQVKEGLAPAFFLNKLNLLDGWDAQSLKDTSKELKKILRRLRKKPEVLFEITGYMQKEEKEEDTSKEEEVHFAEPEYTDSETELEEEQMRDFEEEAKFDSDTYISDKDSQRRAPSASDTRSELDRLSNDSLYEENNNLQSLIAESRNEDTEDMNPREDDESKGRS